MKFSIIWYKLLFMRDFCIAAGVRGVGSSQPRGRNRKHAPIISRSGNQASIKWQCCLETVCLDNRNTRSNCSAVILSGQVLREACHNERQSRS